MANEMNNNIVKSEWPEKYKKLIADACMAQFHYSSVMQIPRIDKVVINYGVGDGAKDQKMLDAAFNEVQAITGLKPILTKSKEAIASFKLREDQPIGVKVTLRNELMWNFLAKLINVALPRVRDFKGLSPKSFDGFGNYTIGIKEQIIFTEINYDDVKRIRGFNITIVFSTNNQEESLTALKAMGFPFKKN